MHPVCSGHMTLLFLSITYPINEQFRKRGEGQLQYLIDRPYRQGQRGQGRDYLIPFNFSNNVLKALMHALTLV